MLALGVVLTPCAALVALLSAHARVGAALGSGIAFFGGAVLPVIGLALAARFSAPIKGTLSVAAWAGTLLAALASMPTHVDASAAALAVDGALVAFGWAVGSSVGRRVQHASHLLPACVVAASADLVSLLSPEGPSHAIARSDRALSVLATWFPVPGSRDLSPALGAGDLLFMALVFGVACARALPYARTVVLCVLGTALAGVAAAGLGVAVPALLPIAVCLIAGLPAARALPAADRKAARWAMIVAGSVALASILRNFWIRS